MLGRKTHQRQRPPGTSTVDCTAIGRCLLTFHKGLGCIAGDANRASTPPRDDGIIESWQYICVGYRKLPGCARAVCSIGRCTFNTGPVPGTEL